MSEDNQQFTLNTQFGDTYNSTHLKEYEPTYISAVVLNHLIKSDRILFIFDVRSLSAFEKNHILSAQSMPYRKISRKRLSSIKNLSKDTQIVTYCGCPRHLATLSAKLLASMNYTNIKILYEGYWYWKDNNYPTFDMKDTPEIEEITFQGTVTDNSHPLKNTNIFLQHEKTGQLEATKTNNFGQFIIKFHVYDYSPTDYFSISINNVNESPIFRLSAKMDTTNHLSINL